MATGGEYASARRARTRAIGALALFAIGALIGAQLVHADAPPMDTIALALCGALVAIGVIGPRVIRAWTLALGVLVFGIGWTMLRVDPDHPDRLDAMLIQLDPSMIKHQRPFPIEVRGTITRSSHVVHRAQGLADPPMWADSSTRAELETTQVLIHRGDQPSDWVTCEGTLRVVVPDGMVVRAGERVELMGRYSPPGTQRNPGDPGWSLLAAQREYVGSLTLQDPSHMRPIAPGGLGARAYSWVVRTRDLIRDRALSSIGADGNEASNDRVAMRAALLLGERDPMFDDVFVGFQRVGVAHVLAISGFHLALVVFMCTLLVRLLGEFPRVETTIIVLILLGVVVVIPLRPPILRAAVLVGAMVLAHRFGRRFDRMTILAWVGVGLLVWRPLDTTSMGYQLSMGVTALLVVLSDAQKRVMLDRQMGILKPIPSRSRSRALVKWCVDLIAVNFACWIVALPIVIYHAGVVGLLAPFASIVLVPLIALMMAMGYAQIILGVISPELASHTMWLIEYPSSWALGVVAWFEQLPFGWARVPRVGALWALSATLVFALVITRTSRVRRVSTIAALCVIGVWGIAHPWIHRASAPMRVVMLDVGDGTCVVVQSGNRGIMWDCGSLDRRVGDSVARSLRTLGIDALDRVIVTHDNLDHYNGIPDLADHVRIGEISITDRLDESGSKAFTRVRDDLESRGLSVNVIGKGDVFTLGESQIEILWPMRETHDVLDDNDTSAVALITRPGSPGVLLTGDIEGPAMDRLRIHAPDLPSRLGQGVIELPHHGSARTEAYAFIDWVDPGVILQSTGPTRLHDERWDLQRPGRAWYTTAAHGAIVVELQSDGTITHGYWFDE